nr:phosphatase PAP2 family protein [Pseudopedobacter sp.]
MKDFGRKHAVQILALISLGFIILTILIIVFPNSWLDSEFSEEVQEHHNSAIDFLMEGISWFGHFWISTSMVLASATLLFIFKKKREAIYCAATLLIGLITYLIKNLINRPRPNSDLVRVIVDTQHQSFPSGHVSFYIVFFGFIAFIFHHRKWLSKLPRRVIIFFCLFLILTVPISRIYLGAHWFTDVLGGFLLGSIFLGFLLFLYLKKEHHQTS